MRIRCVTTHITLPPDLGKEASEIISLLEIQISRASSELKVLSDALTNAEYEVQTTRIAFNSFEQWLLPQCELESEEVIATELASRLKDLEKILVKFNVQFCSLGDCRDPINLKYVPVIIASSSRFAVSFQVVWLSSLSYQVPLAFKHYVQHRHLRILF